MDHGTSYGGRYTHGLDQTLPGQPMESTGFSDLHTTQRPQSREHTRGSSRSAEATAFARNRLRPALPYWLLGKDCEDLPKGRGRMAVAALPGYTGHVPRKQGENIHGLSFRQANEHAVAEADALTAGIQPDPPWHQWASSAGRYPGFVPTREGGGHTMDNVAKPHQVHMEPLDLDRWRPAGSERSHNFRPAGTPRQWRGLYSPAR